MKILFNAKCVYQKNIHNSSLPRLIRFIYVNVFCQRAGINFGRVFVIQIEKKWGCKINCVNFSHALRMHFFPSIRRILTLHLSLAFHYELSSWLSIHLTAPLELYRSLMVLFKYYFCQIDTHHKETFLWM